MHAFIHCDQASSAVLDGARPERGQLEQVMRQTPSFVASDFLEAEEGLTTIPIIEDKAGTEESMGRAANWV